MRRITSALYLDFDNILGGLLKADARAAKAWLDEPGTLVDRLRALDEADGVTRDLLVRRAYLNPNGTVPDPDAPDAATAARLPLSQFRIALTHAGFEVVDCPTLGKGQKNAADIRMVIDVLDAMAGPVSYDEVIIASSDADFTPLLIKLRACDRRTMLVAASGSADAYRVVAGRCLDVAALLAPRLAVVEAPPPVVRVAPDPEARRAARALVALVHGAAEPVGLAAAGLAIRREVGTDLVTDTRWFGYRTLTRFVHERVTNLKLDSTSVWDPARHPAPKAS